MELTKEEVYSLIDRIGAKLGYDFTHGPEYPKGRNDVCVVVHTTENGSTYGYDTVYIVWKELDGSIRHEEIKNSRSTKDYINIKSINVNKDGSISVDFGSGGSFSGVPWSQAMKISLSNGKSEKQAAKDFTTLAKQVMSKVVEENFHDHPLFRSTHVKESCIDEKKKVAAFILFEQIDTDRCTEEGDGYLGDQFRYSLWKLNGNDKPDRIYEDHAYIRRSFNKLTKTRGRDCSLKDLKLEKKKITISHNCGETVEENRWETLTFDI